MARLPAEARVSGWSSPSTRRRRARVSSSRSRAACILAQAAQVGGEVAGGAQRVGVVVAQHAAAAGQGVLVQVPGRLRTRPAAQVDGEVVGGDEGVGVVVAQHAAAAGQDVLVQVAGLGVAAHVPQRPGKVECASPACSRGRRRAGRATAGVESAARSWPVRVSPRASRYQHASQAIQRRSGLPVAAGSAASRCGSSCAQRAR